MLSLGSVVRSKAGHDKNRFYAVVKIERDYLWIADGKERKLKKPKRKNPKHIAKTNTVLKFAEITSDSKLRALLRPFNGENSTQNSEPETVQAQQKV